MISEEAVAAVCVYAWEDPVKGPQGLHLTHNGQHEEFTKLPKSYTIAKPTHSP